MEPVDILESKLAELRVALVKAESEFEYARNVLTKASDHHDKLYSGVIALERAIKVLKNQ